MAERDDLVTAEAAGETTLRTSPDASRAHGDAPSENPLIERDRDSDEEAFARAKRAFLLAAAGIVLGLGVAGTFDRSTGGVILLAAWLGAIGMLHRLGRSGRG